MVLPLHAGFFDNLFGTDKPNETPKIQIEDAEIVEEETITAEEYMDRVEEPTQMEVFTSDIESPKAFEETEVFIDEGDEAAIFGASQTLFVSYLTKPEKIYLSQHAIFTLKAIVTNEGLSAIQTAFENAKDIQVLNPNAHWDKKNKNTYEVSYILKPKSTSARLPDFVITASSENARTSTQTLGAPNTKIVALREDQAFCQVLSSDFTLKNHTEKKYDEQHNIVLLEINATNANLEDFHIPYAMRDGIDDIMTEGFNQSIYYFAIIPNDIKEFKFKYFDIESNKYHIVSFPIVLLDSRVSTQTDLNPQKNRFVLYKAIALLVIGLILLGFYFKTRQLYMLVLSLIVFAFLLYTQIPISKTTLEKGAALRILPTENSTIFYVTEEPVKADILLKKNGYIKVLLPNKKIGWIEK